MTAYVVSSYNSNSLNIASTDSIVMTRFGTILTGAGNALNGAGTNVVAIDGAIETFAANKSGLVLAGGANAVTVGAYGLVYGAYNGIDVTGAGSTITNSGSVTGAGLYGITLSGGGNTLRLDTHSKVQGLDAGINLGGGGNNVVNEGSVAGVAGLSFTNGGNAISNAGVILGKDTGIFLGATGAVNLVLNTGIVQVTLDTAIYANSALNLVNSNTIDGAYNGVYANETTNIVNDGYIFGRGNYGISSGNNADVIINNGFVQGRTAAVQLGNGSDTFDGRNGLQFGGIYGGDGADALFGGAGNDFLYGGNDNDQLSGGAAGDYLDGGAGFDYARYDTGGAVTASLAAPAANTGDAAGDTYVSIEGLIGSQAGDLLVGDTGANTLFGLGGQDGIAGGDGNDTIYGGDGGDSIAGQAGNDVIYGGAGGDVLSGGAGADVFAYASLADGGDLITDFNAGGVRDSFDLRPIFDASGYAGTTPRVGNILKVLQNGADTDVYVYGTFLFRIPNLYAPALDDTYFTFQ